MTQEEEQLLFKVICAELPYGITVQQSAKYPKGHFAYDVADKWDTEPHDFKIIGVEGTNTLITDKRREERTYAKGIVSSPITIPIHNGFTGQKIKPYLRPMSSTTEEEKEDIKPLFLQVWTDDNKRLLVVRQNKIAEYLDYLYSHHLDYSGLIPMGLALEAPEGMYNIK